MKLRVKLVVLILITGLLVSSAIWADKKSPTTQTVVFINSNPGITVLGLAKFVINEKDQLIDVIILNKYWSEEKKILWLEPGYYGVTQLHLKYRMLVNYRSFWVKDKPVLIEMPALVTTQQQTLNL